MLWNRLLLLIVVVYTYDIEIIESARILAIFHMTSRSHFSMLEVLMKELASRQHQVDVVSHFPQKVSIPNYRDLSVEGSLPHVVNNITFEAAIGYSSSIKVLKAYWIYNLDMCKEIFEHPVLQNLLRTEDKYDLVITQLFGADCFLGFGHKFKSPVINIMTSVALPWSNDRVGNPDNPSYIPNVLLPLNSRMSFLERLLNTVSIQALKLGHYLFCVIPTDRVVRRYFGEDLPSISELNKNVSLILVNSHYSLNQPRPLVPAMVEVAGLHMKKPGILPEDINQFLNESVHGAIYFSLGSQIQSETFPEESLQAFVDAFRELPQRVLWKCDGDAIPNLPPNVKTAKWMPQQEILNHENVRVFITHGGMMGTIEAINYGVPMVGIPFFSDQYQNLHNYKTRGLAVVLDPNSITKETVLRSLTTVLNNHSYRENAKKQSRLFRDRPQSALDTAIFWTEYVIRHGGAPHLRSAAVEMPLYQYLLLDVIACLIIGLLISLKIFSFLIGHFLLLGFNITRKLRKKSVKEKSK